MHFFQSNSSDQITKEEMYRYRLLIKALSNSSKQLAGRNLSSNVLPKLPVPPLKDTLSKYLRSVKPLLNKNEFQRTEEKVKKFSEENGVGNQLQELLLKHAEKKDNWLEDWWLKVAYLEFRSPVVFFSSPGLVFPKQTFKHDDDRTQYAAKLVAGAIDYKLKIDNNKIPQEKMGKAPLDMSQYNKVFGTCRIPNKPGDKIEYHPDSRHIVVMHKNHVFKLDVITPDRSPVGVGELSGNLKRIIEQSSKPTDPVGVLTSNNRDAWSEAYSELIKDDGNKKCLKTIASSLFVLCLDSCYKPDNTDDMNLAGLQCMHGGGSTFNGGNRWFDKTIQFIVGKEGHVGLTYEHSPAEGQPIAVMMDHIVNYLSTNSDSCKDNPSKDSCSFEKLKFCTSNVQNHIDQAAHNLDELVGDIETACFKFTHYGKGFVKSLKLSPDSFLQMAMQFAFYRVHEEPGAHYESAATRMYKGGRTETIRSCSIESEKFAKTMLCESSSVSEKIESLKSAVEGHRQYTLQAVQGLGVDRHLLGLKLIAIENNISLPDIYTDEGYVRSLHMRLSTSQVASKCDGFMVYGPLVKDGYACCYNPRDNEVNFGITAHKSCASTNALNFSCALEQSLIDMQNLFAQQSKL